MKKGFTLIELLAAVLIMGILTAVALPQYRRSLERTRVAEALQMLPSIYDARERSATERGYNSWDSIPSNERSQITFKKLDMEMKGTAIGAQGWQTDNFQYTIAPTYMVGARLLRGQYKGLGILFNDSTLGCCFSHTKEGASVCDRVNIANILPASNGFCQTLDANLPVR